MSPAERDRAFVWHPFTSDRPWRDPAYPMPVIVRGEGAYLWDERGNRYWDGNSSIWTNIHGHRHPRLVAAVREQLDRIDHVSFLGLTHPWACELAEKLSVIAGGESGPRYRTFFSDDGATAIEAAVKIVWQYYRQNGQPRRNLFLCLEEGYHGDTAGAMSVGRSRFHRLFQELRFPSASVPSPACYRCPFNRAAAGLRDARLDRRCSWECLRELENALDRHCDRVAALVIEPKVQAAAGMWMHPEGYLRELDRLCRERGILWIADEVFTGLGRLGSWLACGREGVFPDLLCLAKGLTGGMTPLAATLVREEIYEGFRGGRGRAFLHGHSYTANPIGCAAALASLSVFAEERVLERVARRAATLRELAMGFWRHPRVGDVRQEGLVLAVELVERREDRAPFPAEMEVGFRVCERARAYGLLTRPVGDVLVLVPPLCASRDDLAGMVGALERALREELP
ncbi:Adenosylmethionine-8-amino-7-oxononanoate aminotransferase [Methylacidimicrobium sp. AP8]|uniref:adenosylmethionine--8-amino-7-oxononanoate transaminase n=1 Tax=Methylacidimicrobium sp. AP8 TaxID=2730359 RepID=UPI0018BFFE4F|nr:adenosylmethionine--8-amino-7-oxononanoate transaminase [Methylacidimicrobium sp. AP8]CAB4243296.1 Adenosylmethionine-8-amino-7-oxononanoate aminotransferase [Methylacidimicrobium sp. AP8]